MRNFRSKTDLDIINYTNIVNSIANEFFDKDGEYTPYIGKLYAMCVFYNKCVVGIKNKTEIDDILQLQPLINNKKFINAFDKAIKKTSKTKLNFANAYHDAIDIVEQRKSSFSNAVNIIKNAINDVVERMNLAMSEDKLSKMAELAQSVTGGNFDINNLMKNSQTNGKIIDIKK